MLDMIASANPLAKAQKRPQQQTVFGTVMAWTLVPAILIIYSGWWLNVWFGNNKGAIEMQTVGPVDQNLGIALDKEGQSLVCLADSGCWYTIFFETNTRPDLKCPPKAVRDSTLADIQEAANRFGIDAIAPGFRPGLAAATRQTANKKCRWVAKDAKIDTACLYFSTDPIDALTITWEVPNNVNGRPRGNQNFGVGLQTQFPYFNERLARGKKNRLGKLAANATFADQLKHKIGGWFDLETFGGGMAYQAREMPLKVHYGDVALSISYANFEHMVDTRGRPAPNATQLTPNYYTTAEVSPDATNVCYHQNPATSSTQGATLGINGKCGDGGIANGGKCRQLKLRPSAVTVTDTRYIVTPWDTFLGVLGGVASLLMIGLKLLHSVIVLLCGCRGGSCGVRGKTSSLEALERRATALEAKAQTQADPSQVTAVSNA